MSDKDERMHDDISTVQSLGSGKTEYKYEVDPSVLERFRNQFPQRDYRVQFSTDEFTSLCPKTHQPDFARIEVDYIPDEWCVESKGLKLYLFSWRNTGSFMETITNTILTDLVALVKPREMTITGFFAARGGIAMRVVAKYTRDSGIKPTLVEGVQAQA